MAHPKHRTSKAKRDKRRSHHKVADKAVVLCPTTGMPHLYHRAHWHEGKLYYKGKVVIDKAATV
jgi:large subunit ribosomal protein L32